MEKPKITTFKKLREEFLQATDTLWKNEINANIFVAKIMFVNAAITLLFFILAIFHVIGFNNSVMTRTLLQSFFELAIPAFLCLKLKGEKTWLKIILMLFYCIVFARLEMIMGHNVTLCLVFPVVLSVRYYSRPLTAFVTSITILLSGIVEYLGVTQKIMRLDLNMVELPAGTVLTLPEYTVLRDAVPVDLIDYNRLWLHTLQHSYMPKMILFILVALVCMEIAKRGRIAIFDQQAETKKTERLSTELNLASQIQNNVLPNIFPVFPDIKEFDLYASMTPAKEVGGDFYDFFIVDNDHIALVMADVSGKGIPAALFMMVARTLIKNRTLVGGSPSEIISDVNEQLCDGNVAELFVTVWLGIIEISTGKGVAINAGHEHPAVRKKDGKYELIIYKHSPAVATMEGMKFRQHEFKMDPGDSIFVYTDGVTEATNASNELFGNDRLIEALNRNPDAAPEEVLANVKAGIDEFVADAEQFDDITMLCLRYNG
jgi:serine phosphatase RsbU (regulator of sigma subunit)